MGRRRFATVLALGCTGPVLAWGAAAAAGTPAAASSAGGNPSARQPSATSQQEVSPAAAPTLRGSAGGDWLARARRGLLGLSLVGLGRGQGLAALPPGDPASEVPTTASSPAPRGQGDPDLRPAGDSTCCNAVGDDPPAEDGGDCDVADLYALSRHIAGRRVTLEDVCKLHFDSP